MIGDDGRPRDADAPRATALPEGRVAEPRAPLRRVDSMVLLAGAREVEIDHRGELYRLRCTNKGKLILTK